MTGSLGRPWAWVAAAPALCAVHCAATPLLLLAVPALELWRGVELTLLVITAILAGVALTVGYRRHRRELPLLAAVAGLGLWAASTTHLLHQTPEVATTMAGALVAAGALLRNSQLLCLSREPQCGCWACEDEEGDGEEATASSIRPRDQAPGASTRRTPPPPRGVPAPMAGGLSPSPGPGSLPGRQARNTRNATGR